MDCKGSHVNATSLDSWYWWLLRCSLYYPTGAKVSNVGLWWEESTPFTFSGWSKFLCPFSFHFKIQGSRELSPGKMILRLIKDKCLELFLDHTHRNGFIGISTGLNCSSRAWSWAWWGWVMWENPLMKNIYIVCINDAMHLCRIYKISG